VKSVERVVSLLQKTKWKVAATTYPERDIAVVLATCEPEVLGKRTVREAATCLRDKLDEYLDSRPASEVLKSDDPFFKKLHAVVFLVERMMQHGLATVEETLSHEGVLHLLIHQYEGRRVVGGQRRLLAQVKKLEKRLAEAMAAGKVVA
jgi:hypothetical protein